MRERASSHSLAQCSQLDINMLQKEVADLYLSFDEDDDQQMASDVSDSWKPFAAFGSFRQRHGDVRERIRTIEAPAKLESAACAPSGGLSKAFSVHHNEGNVHIHNLTVPSDCDWSVISHQTFKPPHPHHKPYCEGKSFSTDLDREEAWERKKEQYLLEEEDEDADCGDDDDSDYFSYDELWEEPADESSCGSDDRGALHEDGKDNDKCIVEHSQGNLDAVHWDVTQTDEAYLDALHEDDTEKANRRMTFSKKKSFTSRPVKPFIRTRTKSLTNEDLEELRGSIDLGFGFSYNEHCNLKSTLPALELYYAINKNYVDSQSHSSPVSPLDGNALVRTNIAGSTSSPSSETWRISSPGDHPSQVKIRLRHWAQAVACSVKQGY